MPVDANSLFSDVNPTVSIIIPFHSLRNCEWLIDSVCSALEQHYTYLEVIVVDDCSPGFNATTVLEGVRDSRLTCLRLPTNRGTGAAKNVGVQASTGQYIVPLDYDDILEANFV